MEIADIIITGMGLLTLAVIAAGLLRNVPVPFTVALVVVGMGLAELSHDIRGLEALHAFTLTPELVFFIFLPALIFESGLSLNARQLMKDIAPVLTLAVPAMLISTSIIGFALSWLLNIDLVLALLFGALISATDPVAVIALFKELGAPLRLNVLIEGESLLNDATAIVVFGIVLELALNSSGIDAESVDTSDLGFAILEFIRVFLGGTLIGALLGLGISELLYRLRSDTSSILAMSVVTAYASFIIAEHYLHISGVMATVGASMALSIYGLTRIPITDKAIINETWEFVGMVANSLLFLLVGLSINPTDLFNDIGYISIAVAVVLAARAVCIYPLVPIAVRLFKLPSVSMAERHIMWWGGLKGGLAIAIVLSIPAGIEGRELLINLTLGVVLFTLVVNASSIKPLMHKLNLDTLNEDEQAELDRQLTLAEMRTSHLIDQYKALGVLSKRLGERLDFRMHSLFKNDGNNVSRKQARRRVFLFALKTEIDALNQLYGTGIINQYTLMDMRTNLQIDRESYNNYENSFDVAGRLDQQTIFTLVEHWIIKLLRERNIATDLLVNFQTRRLDRTIQRDVAGVVMANLVIEKLKQDQTLDNKEKHAIISVYQRRLQNHADRLRELREDFTNIFATIESRMFSRAALIATKIDIDTDFHHGEIGVKAYNQISQLIGHILGEINREHIDWGKVANHHIEKVDLFKGLHEETLKLLTQHLHEVSFLPGDKIIAEGDRGDSLYIIKKGKANVTRLSQGHSQQIRHYQEGDFFGEIGLLGNHYRTATITAETVVITYRLTRRDVLTAAKQDPEIAQRLEQQRAKIQAIYDTEQNDR